jgi:hypothetical protein
MLAPQNDRSGSPAFGEIIFDCAYQQTAYRNGFNNRTPPCIGAIGR